MEWVWIHLCSCGDAGARCLQPDALPVANQTGNIWHLVKRILPLSPRTRVQNLITREEQPLYFLNIYTLTHQNSVVCSLASVTFNIGGQLKMITTVKIGERYASSHCQSHGFAHRASYNIVYILYQINLGSLYCLYRCRMKHKEMKISWQCTHGQSVMWQ